MGVPGAEVPCDGRLGAVVAPLSPLQGWAQCYAAICTGAGTGCFAHNQCPSMPFRTVATPSGAIALVALVALVEFFLLCG